ncbi:4-hydroxy-tetrahydrodipicolinate reductase [Clostridium intestinale]|uniref:4-hydroxy-tetrahydrodipicolinate reductase n=1 Tax=Clostridium intestinale DSM 6191 TaxID=1121320 RepID=A0A1M5YI57_9CLOT|nr:4-hydroxy-tetrahydrodipicolinate reductase [Clostridium intestinale]SHI11731.1 dihydrodipicolinate reductase [Clostridium intestinale DSM 6191]
MIKVCLLGLGRTGKEIAKVLLEEEDIDLTFVVCSKDSEKANRDLGEVLNISNTGVNIIEPDELEGHILKYKPQVAIDFSKSEAAIENAKILSKMKVKIIIGTTGFNELQHKKLVNLARENKTAIVHAPNITVGVNVLMTLTNIAAGILQDYDSTIIESHFKEKKEAPTSTAKKIANEIVKGHGYEENINNIDINSIPILSVRAGGIVGKHKVIMAGEHDKIEITHESFSRKAFALGALRAVRFIVDKTGYYEMDDVLNLKEIMNKFSERSILVNQMEN